MDFACAMKALRRKNSVFRNAWKPKTYLLPLTSGYPDVNIEADGKITSNITIEEDSRQSPWNPTMDDIRAKDWLVVSEEGDATPEYVNQDR